MSTAAELLATLRQKDVKLWLDGDKLRYRAAKGTLSPELLAQLKTASAGPRQQLSRRKEFALLQLCHLTILKL